ncbi:hypothetical protein AYO44_13295 [Planctomycetaceae bacterium SCGC AG-212-F19]|nr:hypothetical protein AYO44_13295 [Planctomycetaceae bacterium SCGC AG-212-F19]
MAKRRQPPTEQELRRQELWGITCELYQMFLHGYRRQPILIADLLKQVADLHDAEVASLRWDTPRQIVHDRLAELEKEPLQAWLDREQPGADMTLERLNATPAPQD